MSIAQESSAAACDPASSAVREVVRIGTRASALALVQAGMVVEALSILEVPAQLTMIVTEGDRRAADTPWGEGAFVGAIEKALLDGSVDLAVHSAKDVPTDEDPRLRIAAYLRRAAPEDVLVLPLGETGSLETLAARARVGTDSPRRTAFLRASRPDLRVHPLHGNVDTRLRRLDDGETDALVLAAAGLDRLGLAERISAVLDTELIPSAAGQGALAIQIRTADAATAEIVGRLDDPDTRRAVEAERALVAASGGGCRAPLGVLASTEGGILTLRAGFASIDGSVSVRSRVTSDAPCGDEAAIHDGLSRLADAATAMALDIDRPRVVVTRAVGDAIPLRLALIDAGLAPVLVPCIDIEDALELTPVGVDRWAALDDAEWVVLSSRHGATRCITALRERPWLRVAAVGPSVARPLRAASIEVAVIPSVSTAAALAERIPLDGGERVVVVRGDLAGDGLADRLRKRGARVDSIVAYRTIEGPVASRDALRRSLRQSPRAVVMTSGSTVRGWLTLAAAIDATQAARAIPCIAIGPSTAAACREAGLAVTAESPAADPGTVAATVAAALHDPQETP